MKSLSETSRPKKYFPLNLRLPRVMGTSVFKLALGLLLVFIFTAICSLGYVIWKSGSLMQEQISQSVHAESVNLETLYRRDGLRRLATTIDERAAQPNSFLYVLTLPNGQPLMSNMSEWPLAIMERAHSAEIDYTRLSSSGDSNTAYSHRAWVMVKVLPGGFRVLVGRDLGERVRLIRVLTQAALGGLMLMVVLGFSGAFLISRRMITRLHGISRASQHIMAGNLEQRLPINGSGDEFDQLAHATNAMLERIADLRQDLREMGDNIAHDLKTPLTRLRSQAEEALRNTKSDSAARFALEKIIQDSDELLGTFNAILLLARLEAAPTKDNKEPLDLKVIVEELYELYEPVAEDTGFTFILDAPEVAIAKANRELIARALSNLLDNAFKYGNAENGLSPRITLALQASEKECLLRVTDTGQGIPEHQRERALERFVRLEDSRTRQGTGLGLSIVEAIMRYHGGTIELQGNEPHGLSVILKMPALPLESQ